MQTPSWLLGPALLPTGLHSDGAIRVDGDRITWAGLQADAPELSGRVLSVGEQELLAPGFVDMHCHGGGGAGFGSQPEQVLRAADFHARRGTTSVIASLVTAEPESMLDAVRACGDLCAAGVLAGIHLEGPFLSPVQRGAHDPHWLRPVELDLVERLLRAGGGALRMMTYAPELARADRLVDVLLEHGVRPAIGHTDASASITSAALTAATPGGQRAVVTHLFNAMPPWRSRVAGPVPATLVAAAAGTAVLELIADGIHLSPDTVAATFALAAQGCVALVSDATAAAGEPDGDYRLGSLEVTVQDGVARLATSAALAGGTATLAEIVRGCIAAGLDVEAVLRAASSTPAAAAGIDAEVGSLQPGLRADVVVLDRDAVVLHVMRAGTWLGDPPDRW